MLDLIRVGTPTLPESGDVFHFKQTLDHSLGGEEVYSANEIGEFGRFGVHGTYNTCTL